jgi:hypothetical protein
MKRGRPHSLLRESKRWENGPRKGESIHDVVAKIDYAAALVLALMRRGRSQNDAIRVALDLELASDERDVRRRLRAVKRLDALWMDGPASEDAMAWWILQQPEVSRLRQHRRIAIPDDLLNRPTPTATACPNPEAIR